MTEEQVTILMESSKSESEWNANRDKVVDACGGYPDFWYASIVLSGLVGRVAMSWCRLDREVA